MSRSYTSSMSGLESVPEMPALSDGNSESDSVSELGSEDISVYADDIVAAGNAAAAAPTDMARSGITPMSLTLLNATQAPLDPMSMWQENADNARLDRLNTAAASSTAAESLVDTTRPRVTPVNLMLHNAAQAPLDPLSMWKEDTDNARIERLFCGQAKGTDPSISAAVQRCLADESLKTIPGNVGNGNASAPQ